MHLRELLPREHIVVPLDAETVRDALAVLARRLADAGALRIEPDDLERLLGDRRLRDLVAVGREVVLPHFRTEAVEHLVLALGVSPRPLGKGESRISTEPRVVVLILAPPEAATLYLQTVSTLARLFRTEDVTRRISAARTPEDVLGLPELQELKIQPRLTVRDMMVTGVETVPADLPVRDAVDMLLRQGLRALPVIGPKDEVLGLVTERDIMRELIPQVPRAGDEPESDERAPQQRRVRDIMSRSVLCISEDMGLDEVSNILVNKDVDQIPVVREGKFTGLLSRGDIIRKLFARPQPWP